MIFFLVHALMKASSVSFVEHADFPVSRIAAAQIVAKRIGALVGPAGEPWGACSTEIATA